MKGHSSPDGGQGGLKAVVVALMMLMGTADAAYAPPRNVSTSPNPGTANTAGYWQVDVPWRDEIVTRRPNGFDIFNTLTKTSTFLAIPASYVVAVSGISLTTWERAPSLYSFTVTPEQPRRILR